MHTKKILLSIPTKSHVEIAIDELTGLQDLGYICKPFDYAGKEGHDSKISRLWLILRNAFKLVRLAHAFKPDIIYFNSRLEKLAGIRDYLTIKIIKIFYKKKVSFVIKSHGSDLEVVENAGSFRDIVLRFLKDNVSAWLFLSSEEKDKLSTMNYFNKNNLFVVKNIVRHYQFKEDAHFKINLGIPPDHKILLFTGRIIEEKGVIEAVEAFSALKGKYPLTLIIVGDGDAMDRVKAIITASDLTNVILTGFIPEQAVIPYYANSDILVFPTYFPEGFPMALFNAVGAGLAVVTTKIRAAKDYLTEPENCLWVNPKNSPGVTKAIEQLLNSNESLNYMREENKTKSKMFGKEQVATELSLIFDQI
jgi:glycosyltransferase involved in cell wall biosynthesis